MKEKTGISSASLAKLGKGGNITTDVLLRICIVKELYSDGLMNTADLNCTMSSSGMVAPRVSEIGRDFIDFITENK